MSELSVFEFRSPSVIRLGRGVLAKLPEDARAAGILRALLVIDHNLAKSGYSERICELCRQAGIQTAVYEGVDKEPTTQHVEQGLAEFRRFGADGLIALGGGSALDVAKAVAAMSTNPGRIADYMVPRTLAADRAPLVCVPTTAGTGSEVTRFCIITDPETNVKMLISDPRLIPDAAIDDPQLTDSCPPGVTAATGIDALTHAIEAYVSRRATPLSSLLALSAIRRISASLKRAFEDGSDQPARDAMMVGQLEAGLAFSNASVCLVHGMARPLGAYFHLSHGLSNAVLLPTVMAWSLEAAAPRYADIARALGCRTEGLSDQAGARAGAEAVADLCRNLKLPTLAEAVGGADRLRAVASQMAKDALASGSPGNNPRVPTEQEIVSLYQAALGLSQQ